MQSLNPSDFRALASAWSMCPLRFWATLASLLAFPAAARATPDGPLVVALEYEVPEAPTDCPSAAEFRKSVREQLTYDAFEGEPRLRVVARIESSELGLRGRIVWTDPQGVKQGERQLNARAGDCAELARGLSFAIAVQIELLNGSHAETAQAQPTAPSTPSAPPPGATRGNRSSKPDVSPPNPLRTEFALGAGPTASLGGAPSLSAGARLFGAVRWRDVSLELGVEGELPVSKTNADASGFSLTSFGASLAPCAHRGALSVCGVAAVSRLRVRGFGVDEVRSPASTTARAGARFAIAQSLSERLRLVLHTDGLFLLARRTIYVNAVPVWTTPDAEVKVGLDVATFFQ